MFLFVFEAIPHTDFHGTIRKIVVSASREAAEDILKEQVKTKLNVNAEVISPPRFPRASKCPTGSYWFLEETVPVQEGATVQFWDEE
jgi:hypothetical protein